MKIYGLTGSIGMGKSAVAAMLRREGVPLFDADAEVHRLQGPGGALLPAIEARFPGTTGPKRSEEQTSELQSLMRNSLSVFCLKKKTKQVREHYKKRNSIE